MTALSARRSSLPALMRLARALPKVKAPRYLGKRSWILYWLVFNVHTHFCTSSNRGSVKTEKNLNLPLSKKQASYWQNFRNTPGLGQESLSPSPETEQANGPGASPRNIDWYSPPITSLLASARGTKSQLIDFQLVGFVHVFRTASGSSPNDQTKSRQLSNQKTAKCLISAPP